MYPLVLVDLGYLVYHVDPQGLENQQFLVVPEDQLYHVVLLDQLYLLDLEDRLIQLDP